MNAEKFRSRLKVVLQSGDSVEAVASAASSIDIITSVVDTISA